MKISIIIPVYNAENCLSQCLESILANSYQDYELILIDDKSSDSSIDICEEYLLKDNRIHLYKNIINKGISATRNRGIELAKGEYIMFCDNDDIVSPLWIEHLLEWLKNNDSILPICGICNTPSSLSIQKDLSNIHSTIFNKEKYFLFNQLGIAGYIWNTIYKRDIIEKNQIRFKSRKEKGDINEDLIFSMEYLKHIEYVIYNGYTDYCHTQNETNHSTVTDNNYYFNKYQEKYNIWKNFIISNKYNEQDNDIKLLATNILYHLLYSFKLNSNFNLKSIFFYKKVVYSKEINEILMLADLEKENMLTIKLLKRKKYLLLWLINYLLK